MKFEEKVDLSFNLSSLMGIKSKVQKFIDYPLIFNMIIHYSQH